MRKSLAIGAAAAATATAPLLAVSFLGWQLFDFPFAPFDLFDWFTRQIPGAAITWWIALVVRAAGGLGVNAAVAGKLVEQGMAVASVACAAVALAAVLSALLSLSREPTLLPGAVLGAALGGLVVLVEENLNRLPSPGAAVSGTWLFATWFAWGLVFGWMVDRLDRPEPEDRSSNVTPDSTGFDAGRRQFFGRAGRAAIIVTTVSGAMGWLLGSRRENGGTPWSATHAMPNAAAAMQPVPGTRAEFTPLEQHYRIDAVTRAPALSGSRWRLQVGGLVARPLSLTLDELRAFDPQHVFVTLSCISNPVGGDLIGTTRWTGVSLQRLLPRLALAPAATHLKWTSADGFSEVVSLATVASDERVMLAYAWDGVPLPIDHGFPLRLYVPDRYGMKQPKWITSLVVLDHWEPGYWVERGWDRDGLMKSTAVTDAIVSGHDGATTSIGGIAHAGARGVSRVEVQVDDGKWQPATLRDPLSTTTWVLWRAEIALPAGEHVVVARCYEGDGTPQTAVPHRRSFRI